MFFSITIFLCVIILLNIITIYQLITIHKNYHLLAKAYWILVRTKND